MRLWDLGLKSLQTRLLLGAFLWIAAGLLVSGIAISGIFREHVAVQFHHELEDHLTELQGLSIVGSSGHLSILRPVSDPRFSASESGYYWEIRQSGLPVLRSESLAGRDLTVGGAHRMDVARRSVRIDPRREPFNFEVAGDTSELTVVMARFNRLLFTSLSVIAIGLFVAAAAQVGFGLHPLRRLRLALGDVRGGRAERLSDDFPTEVRPLVSDLNALIDAQADMIRRARSQAGNMGHALRTPLAILMAQARTLAANGHAEIAEAILVECRAMTRQVDYQVARARAAASRAGVGAHVIAALTVDEIISAMEKIWAERGLVYCNEVPRNLIVAVNSDDLGEILANLIDNAAKWAGHEIRLTGETVDHGVILTIEDDGPGIPIENRERAFCLGERLDQSKPGSGLGLAIVKDLVDLYGRNVSLTQSNLGGLKAVVTLPFESDRATGRPETDRLSVS